MKRLLFFFIISLFTFCNKANSINGPWASDNVVLPRPDKVIVVWFENHGYKSIVGSPNAPYINSLIPLGTLFDSSYAFTHPSYPNYIYWFSGSTQGVTNDNCINTTPYTYPNLYSSLDTQRIKFCWYNESMPSLGFKGCTSYPYVEKHNPTTIFTNVRDSANKPFSMFNWQDTSSTNMAKLERVTCITPNMQNDMHDGTILQADTWLKNNLGKLISYAQNHNYIVVIYYDESETTLDNRLPVIAIGGMVKKGYVSKKKYTHLSWLRTICSYYGGINGWNAPLRAATFVDDIYK